MLPRVGPWVVYLCATRCGCHSTHVETKAITFKTTHFDCAVWPPGLFGNAHHNGARRLWRWHRARATTAALHWLPAVVRRSENRPEL